MDLLLIGFIALLFPVALSADFKYESKATGELPYIEDKN